MSKTDGLKAYTGRDTIEALLEGKTIEKLSSGVLYRFEEGKLLYMSTVDNIVWSQSAMGAQTLMTNKFKLHEIQLPQVGDWVKITSSDKNRTYVGKAEKVSDKFVYANWGGHGLVNALELKNWEILSPEQVSEHKREQVFVKVGRKPNEFKNGDIVCINADGGVSIVVSNNNEETVRVHMLNVPGKGYTAKPHQIRPISFVEHQVSLD